MTAVTYSNFRSYSGNRPYSYISLLGVGGMPDVNFNALVDTGADYLQLPLAAAMTAGLNVSSGQPIPVNGATGAGSMLLISGVDVEVEGKIVTVDGLFDPSNVSPALLGRQCMLAALEAGFNVNEWLWKL